MIQNVALAQRRLLISRQCLGPATSYIDVSRWIEILSGSEAHTRVYIQHKPPYLIRRLSLPDHEFSMPIRAWSLPIYPVAGNSLM